MAGSGASENGTKSEEKGAAASLQNLRKYGLKCVLVQTRKCFRYPWMDPWLDRVRRKPVQNLRKNVLLQAYKICGSTA